MSSASTCLEPPIGVLTNLEGAHRVHGWSTPLAVSNASDIGLIVTLNSIGNPKPYVHDVASTTLRSCGCWEFCNPVDTLRKAAGLDLLPHGTFLDVGAQLGYFSLAFASYGFRVLAIEPMLQNVLALKASACLHTPGAGSRIRVYQTAIVGPSQTRGTCAVLSPWRGVSNDFSNGLLECVNRSHRSFGRQCSRKHEGKTLLSNFTYFFHYRRFCQQIAPPLQTLDNFLDALERPGGEPLAIVKIDVAGSECDVLAGARSTLLLLHPPLLIITIATMRAEACVASIAATYNYTMHPMAAAEDECTRRGAATRHVVLSLLS